MLQQHFQNLFLILLSVLNHCLLLEEFGEMDLLATDSERLSEKRSGETPRLAAFT